MPISRIALLAFLLVLAVGLEPAIASAPEPPAPSGSAVPAGVALATSAPADGGEPSPGPIERGPIGDGVTGLPLGGDGAGTTTGITPGSLELHADPSPAASIDPTPEPTPAPTCPPAPEGTNPVPAVRNGSRSQKVVALTFDDGWDGPNTLRILKILRNGHVNATFFPLGRAIEIAPSAWRTVVEAGYPIADHTYDHATLAGRCYRTQLAELTRFEATVQRVLGVTPLPVTRPPGGAYDVATRRAADGAGDRALVLWDVDTRDWTGVRAATITSTALAGQSGSIVLMHTYPDATAAALPGIIAGYRARGFGFVTIGQMLGIPGPVPFG